MPLIIELDGLFADGVFGLGYLANIPDGLDANDNKFAVMFNRDYWDGLRNQKVIDKVMFGINIEIDPKTFNRPSTFSVGGFDANIIEDIEDMNMHSVSKVDTWSIPIEGVMVNGDRLDRRIDCRPI